MTYKTHLTTQCATLPGKHWYQSRFAGLPNPHFKPNRNLQRIRNTYLKERQRGFWDNNRRSVLGRFDILQLEDNKSKSKFEKKKKRIKCFICKKHGHFCWTCKDRYKKNIGTFNHNHRPQETGFQFFPKIYLDGNYLVKGTETGNWNHIWYISKYQPQHLAQNRRVLEGFKYKYYAQKLNGQEILVRGIGQVNLNVEDVQTEIKDVLYCPNININILSLNQLWEQGFTIRSDDYKVDIIKRMDDGWYNKTKRDEEDQIRKDLEEMGRWSTDSVVQEYAAQDGKEVTDQTSLNRSTLEPQNKVTPGILKGIMEMIDFTLNEEHAYHEVRSLQAKQFADMVDWFNNSEYADSEDKAMPLTIGPKHICLMDLYILVKKSGGAGLITLEQRWGNIAMALGFPEWYETRMKEGFIRYLHKIDICYDIVKTAHKYYDDLEEDSFVVKDHNTFMKYMDLLQDATQTMKYKRMFRNSFEEVISWFHTELVDGIPDLAMPPTIGTIEICLFDLYVYLIRDGGLDRNDDKWEEAALAFGFLEGDKYDLKGIAKKYLLMPDVYYQSMKSCEEDGASNSGYDTQEVYPCEGNTACEVGNGDDPQWSTTEGRAQEEYQFEATTSNTKSERKEDFESKVCIKEGTEARTSMDQTGNKKTYDDYVVID